MKKSYYNFIFKGNEGQSVLYNSRTGAMAELDADSAEQYASLTDAELEVKNPELAESLLVNGFAVDDNVSELDMIRYDMLQTRFGSTTLGVTIAVTKDCNFGCKYCYEKEVLAEKYMDVATQDAIVNYLKENLIAEGSLSICWYGGEPLLDIDAIEYMSARLMEVCGSKKIEYDADIITNGYLLTPDLARRLIKCNVKLIQITLDGDEETHNKRRPMKDGTPTYQTIWNNLLQLKEYKKEIVVALRVNIDKTNENVLNEISEKVIRYEMDDFVHVYPGRVLNIEGCHNGEVCHNNKEFALIEKSFYATDKEKMKGLYPKPRKIHCAADNDRCMVFDANGDMYKCLMAIGRRDFCIGNIKTQELYSEDILHKYLLMDATKECSLCKFLPLCMGGCPHERLLGNATCANIKYTLEEYVCQMIR